MNKKYSKFVVFFDYLYFRLDFLIIYLIFNIYLKIELINGSCSYEFSESIIFI